MASLTKVAITTRKAVRYSIYLIIFLIVGRVALQLIVSVAQKIFPPQQAAPTVQFGKLPTLPFPVSTTNTSSLTYTIQTPEGSIPTLASQAKVYFMPQGRPDLLALDNAKTKASSLGFASTPAQESQTLYKFTNTNGLSTLEINIVTGTFSLGYNLNADNSPLVNKPPAASDGGTIAKSFLSRGSLLPDDLSGPVTSEYLKSQNKQLVSAIALSEANFTKINLFRKDFDKIPSVTAKPQEANVWFLLSGSQDQGKQIVGAQYYYYPVDETQFATYPLKTATIAFKELQSGKGFIANLGDNRDGKIIIRRVYLAYYDSSTPTQFYQPVIVFEGDNGFIAYVPAVTGIYYSE